MRLLLANMDLYEECLSDGVLRYQAGLVDVEAFDGSENPHYMIQGQTAVINVSGPLTYRSSFWSFFFGGTSYTSLMRALNAAENDSAVNRVVLVMDTPGGEVTGLVEIADTMAQCDKEIVAMVDPCCASAGLWIASQADRIVSVKSGEVGSLGVQAVMVSYTEYYKKLGIDVQVFRAAVSPEKNLGHPAEPIGEEAKKYIQSKVDQKGQLFVDTVAVGRGVSTATVMEKFGQGRMLEADEALSVGLIDSISSLQEVLGSGAKDKKKRQYSAIHRR